MRTRKIDKDSQGSTPRRKKRVARFASVTKGIRLRPDQVEALTLLMIDDPELDWSMAARRGIDLFLAEQEGRIQLLKPAGPRPLRRVFQSISAAARASDD